MSIDLFWNRCIKTKYDILPSLSTELNLTTLDESETTFKTWQNRELNDDCHKKVAFRFSSTCKAKYVSTENNIYTGFFAENNETLFRLSIEGRSLAIGLKYFVTGQKNSMNLLFISKTESTNRDNYFKNGLFNTLSGTDLAIPFFGELINNLNPITTRIAQFFLSIIIINIDSARLSQYTNSNQVITKCNAPQRLIIKPTKYMQDLGRQLPDNLDYRVTVNKIPPNKHIYNLYDQNDLHIGEIYNTTKFVSCKFSDVNLHYFHQYTVNISSIVTYTVVMINNIITYILYMLNSAEFKRQRNC